MSLNFVSCLDLVLISRDLILFSLGCHNLGFDNIWYRVE